MCYMYYTCTMYKVHRTCTLYYVLVQGILYDYLYGYKVCVLLPVYTLMIKVSVSIPVAYVLYRLYQYDLDPRHVPSSRCLRLALSSLFLTLLTRAIIADAAHVVLSHEHAHLSKARTPGPSSRWSLGHRCARSLPDRIGEEGDEDAVMRNRTTRVKRAKNIGPMVASADSIGHTVPSPTSS